MDKKRNRTGALRSFLFACVITAPILICACSHYMARPSFGEANEYFSQGNYIASLSKYEQIMKKYPAAGDRVLFEMGIIYAYPGNEQKDYQKSLECFQKLLKDYPESRYRQDSVEMIAHVDNVAIKDKRIIALQKQITTLEQELKSRDNEVAALRKKIEALERELKNRISAIPNTPADRILIEKRKRRLTLIARDKVLKMYKIALGGNPDGPKIRQGDNKTPEGTYIIDSRNRDSRYHLALHISYPNDEDRKRARRLGVSPGGNIMIHGLRNGFSWIGDFHTANDWTKGCIAVTNEEIEEIARLVRNGTIVHILP